MEWQILIFYIILLSWYLFYFVCLIVFYKLYDRELPTPKVKEYFNKPPKFLSPGRLSFLMYGKIVPSTFTATILILIKRGLIKLKFVENDVILIHTPNDTVRLSASQKYILEFLFMTVTNSNKELSLKALNSFCDHSANNSTDFLNNYQIWQKIVVHEDFNNNYYANKIGAYSYVRFLGFLTIILVFLNFYLGVHHLAGYVTLILFYLIRLYMKRMTKRTEQGNLEYNNWLSFNRYLLTYNQYQEKELFDSYLIYGSVLRILPIVTEKIKTSCDSKELDVLTKASLENDFIIKLDIAILKLHRNAVLYGHRKIF